MYCLLYARVRYINASTPSSSAGNAVRLIWPNQWNGINNSPNPGPEICNSPVVAVDGVPATIQLGENNINGCLLGCGDGWRMVSPPK